MLPIRDGNYRKRFAEDRFFLIHRAPARQQTCPINNEYWLKQRSAIGAAVLPCRLVLPFVLGNDCTRSFKLHENTSLTTFILFYFILLLIKSH